MSGLRWFYLYPSQTTPQFIYRVTAPHLWVVAGNGLVPSQRSGNGMVQVCRLLWVPHCLARIPFQNHRVKGSWSGSWAPRHPDNGIAQRSVRAWSCGTGSGQT